ncbi:5-oxoprolinase subunit PxpB [Staphylococcus pragensis]|uniref:5-oxoprolinase subunit PxpB n=1 Tax=Staphylococcus pragensis TaxID=1611836 RepID=A0A4Z1C1W0_9STAP|nr:MULTISPECIES: 5-oxoprolinase subunit PxpB [Staphylococcus]RTX87627.1 5-oxoprolinase subunit PxpB [Staphylococcus carnosus]TGN28925.1 5-oxoprolinase subunit PxpB [Staphylococcus pragensis]GGG84076.1 allophanate hydrolase [Staphylococcus pragensis]
MEIKVINEQSILLYFKEEISEQNYKDVDTTTQYILSKNISAIRDVVPSYRAIMINFDNKQLNYEQLITQLELDDIELSTSNKNDDKKVIHIPVLYNLEVGPDLEEVAKHNNLSIDEVIKIHTDNEYLIYMLGFMPGFPFLGGLDKRLHTPRRSEPRVKINAGSVGIANNQTGLYPSDSPGGWQIIGRTPLKVFDQYSNPMTLYEAGDYIKFYAIDESTFKEIETEIANNKFNKEKWVTNNYEH